MRAAYRSNFVGLLAESRWLVEVVIHLLDDLAGRGDRLMASRGHAALPPLAW
jgi:hypothetical protein